LPFGGGVAWLDPLVGRPWCDDEDAGGVRMKTTASDALACVEAWCAFPAAGAWFACAASCFASRVASARRPVSELKSSGPGWSRIAGGTEPSAFCGAW